MNRLGKFTDNLYPKAEGTLMFGVPVEELSRNDLLACITHLNQVINSNREQHAHDIEFMKDIGNIRRR